MQQRAAKCLSLLLYGAALVGALWLLVRFLLPWMAPFLLAFSLAALLEPAVRLLVSRGWPRGAAAGLLTAALLGLMVSGLTALAGRGITAASAFARQTPELMNALSQGIHRVEERALAAIETAPEGVADYLRTALDALGDALYGLPGLLSQWALDALGKAAQSSGDVLLFAVTAGIGTYFISAAFPRVLAFLAAQLPEEWRQRFSGLGRDLKGNLGAMLRAQLILMGMTFFALLLGFLLLGIPGAMGIAALTALIDALPVFGAGIVLLPWALYETLLWDYGRALGLFLCWALVTLLRSCAQAKLLGDQIGLEPLASLLAIYVGWRVCGVWGMLLFPLLMVTLQQLNDRGVLRLWKNP